MPSTCQTYYPIFGISLLQAEFRKKQFLLRPALLSTPLLGSELKTSARERILRAA